MLRSEDFLFPTKYYGSSTLSITSLFGSKYNVHIYVIVYPAYVFAYMKVSACEYVTCSRFFLFKVCWCYETGIKRILPVKCVTHSLL